MGKNMSGTLENLRVVVKTIPKGPKNMHKTSKKQHAIERMQSWIYRLA